ncbi:MAG: cellulase family glycosylhydrolase [Thermoguttaceae bacterium]|jgi:aryl-phospho-beta-D-glucosidase BglC (GH1 family)
MRRVTRILAAVLLTVGVLETSAASAAAAERPWLPASAEKLPRWRGFNLLEKFYLGSGQKPFLEDDFRQIARLGFNFVRLPMDYRLWIAHGNWEEFDEATLREIDQAVAWGRKYGIHVAINFHRAPGYTVAQPPERTSLWSDADTQRVCAKHWAMFARRYRGIPSARLSFNLMNEPGQVEAKTYVAVVRRLVQAIRGEDPDRLIIADGLQWGNVPVPELRELHVAEAARGYTPMEISHYQANWVNGQTFPYPHWPCIVPPNGTLLGIHKPEGSYPLVIDGPFSASTELRLHVLTVSTAALLVVEADGQPVFQKQFRCGPGKGEWKKAQYKQQWQIYQNLFDRDYATTIPAGARQVRIRVTEGDWLEIGQIGLKPAIAGAKETTLTLRQEFGKKPEPFRYAPGAPGGPLLGLPMQDRTWLWKTCIEPWKKAESQGIGVMVGEWGVYNKTPHDVVLRWAEDCLSNWQTAGWGWAMWNFRGSMGILDSGRDDVQYEQFEGHKLDRKLLDLLQRY